MNSPPVDPRDPRVYFAAERTLLAWIRTSLAIMALGFVVARFGIFLRELGTLQGKTMDGSIRFSPAIGTLLVLLGVVVAAGAAWRHWLYLGRFERGEPPRMGRLSGTIVVSLLLALFGLGLMLYLVRMS